MYRLIIAPSAKRGLKKSKKLYQEAINSVLLELRDEPYAGKPLTKELAGKFSFRVGSYRIIYTINETDKIIRILHIGHRATIYN